MNVSTNYSTTNQAYKHLSEAERGKIEAYLCSGIKPAEIARRLGKNRSTITCEINKGSITQVKKVNGQKVYYQHCYADAVQNRYRYAREASYYLKLDRVSDDFLIEFTEAMKEKPRIHSVDAYSTYDQGTNEHFNGLLREFISKGINERPKRILGYQSAKKAV